MAGATRAATPAEPRASEARERLLRTATRIFYAKGVHSVGTDELIAAAKVTRATFYRHFPSKDDLIVAYLTNADLAIRAQTEALVDATSTPVEAVRAIAGSVAAQIRDRDFRGCAFLNAAAEFPDARTRVHRVVLEHRAWFRGIVEENLVRALGEPADAAARLFVMLRDGAMSAGCLGDVDEVCESFERGVEDLLARAPKPAARKRR